MDAVDKAARELMWKEMGPNRWRMELSPGGFFLHVHDDGVTVTANVKGPAGLLNVSKGGFRKFSATVPWASAQVRAWLRRHKAAQARAAAETKGAKRVRTNSNRTA